MRTLSACIAISLVFGGAPCLGQSGKVQSLTDKDSSGPVENLGFERKAADEGKGLVSDWGAGEGPSKKASPQLTASEANKANYISLTGGGGYRIDRVTPGPSDKVASITIIYNGQFVDLPGGSFSKGDSPGTLRTGLTSQDLTKYDAAPPERR